jgi:hypothetical protein
VSLPALAGFEKSLVDSSGHGALCRVGPFGTESFRRPLRFTARKSAGIPSSATELWRTQSVPPFAHCNPLRTFAETILMCLKPHPAQGERPSTWAQNFSKSLAKPEDVFSKACQGRLFQCLLPNYSNNIF